MPNVRELRGNRATSCGLTAASFAESLALSMSSIEPKRVVEAALLCTQQPLSVNELCRLFEEEIPAPSIRELLGELEAEWHGRSLVLREVASGWRFQTRPEMAIYLERLHPERPPRYSRAVLETLAIVAFRQPVTRGDIEDIRGVTVSPQIVRTLEERGWIEVVGHREVPGRPALFATTRRFLDDLGLQAVTDLPALESLAGGEPLDEASAQTLAQAALALDPDCSSTQAASEDDPPAAESSATRTPPAGDPAVDVPAPVEDPPMDAPVPAEDPPTEPPQPEQEPPADPPPPVQDPPAEELAASPDQVIDAEASPDAASTAASLQRYP